MTRSRIGQELDLHQRTVSSKVEALIQRGLVQEIGDEVVLTEKGREYMGRVDKDLAVLVFTQIHA